MALSQEELAEVVAELQPLLGSKIQRVDVVAEREFVLALRYPGRTVLLLLSAHHQHGRMHVVQKRPPKQLPAAGLQALLRSRLTNKLLCELSVQGKTIYLEAGDSRLAWRIDGGKKALEFIPTRGLKVEFSQSPDKNHIFAKSLELEQRYQEIVPQDAGQTLKQRLQKELRGRLKKKQRLLANLEKDRAKLEKMQHLGHQGELLKTVMGSVKRGQKTVSVFDWLSGGQVDLALDPALDAKGNLARFFQKAKKAARGLPQVEKRSESILEIVIGLEERLEKLEKASGEEIIAQAAEESIEKQYSNSSKDSKGPSGFAKWARHFLAVDGTDIWVGRGAKENDRLSLSCAKADDTWMHVRGISGAHVLIPNPKKQQIHPETILDAAHLAAHYSSAKNDSKVEIMVTEARFVKKTKGAAPGLVGVSRSKTLLINMEPERIQRLMNKPS